MKKWIFLFCLIVSFFDCHSQFHRISPLIGIRQWDKSSLEIGVCSEFGKGKERFMAAGEFYRSYFAIAQSLSLEITPLEKTYIIPKYSFWIHSDKLFLFTLGSSLLYASADVLFIRPELGIILPKDKMHCTKIGYLRLKLTYGYNISFNQSIPYNRNNISLIFYFGNNTGKIDSRR